MKCGIDEVLRVLPPWNCEMPAAYWAARLAGTPRAASDDVTWLRIWETSSVPRMARPRLAV
jgi:hypothetical protein